jgi:periplasmic protein CpxP/Spy
MTSKLKSLWLLALLLTLALAGAIPAGAQYQDGGPGGQARGGPRRPMSPDDRLKQMTKDLKLTDDEQAKIKPILVDEQKKMEDLRNDSSGDRQSMRGKMMQIRKDASDQVRKQLDDKQKEKFDKQEQEREDRMKNRRGPGPGGPDGENPQPQN